MLDQRLTVTDFHIMTLSRVSGSPVSPDASCKFGATSWLEELVDGVSNIFAPCATVSSVFSKSARLSSCL